METLTGLPESEARESFEIGSSDQENKEKISESEQEFLKSLDILAEMEKRAAEEGRRMFISEIGAVTGKAFVRYISANQKHAQPLHNPLAKTAIENASATIRALLPEKQAEEFLSGFLTEYAVAHALTQSLLKEVYYASLEEDSRRKIDWVVKEPDEDQEIYLQVKSLPIDEQFQPSQLLFPINNPEDIQRMADTLYSYKYKHDISFSYIIKRATTMYERNKDSQAKIAVLFIPHDQLNPVAGLLSHEVINQLDDEFSELN